MTALLGAFRRFACYLAKVVQDIHGGVISGLDSLWYG